MASGKTFVTDNMPDSKFLCLNIFKDDDYTITLVREVLKEMERRDDMELAPDDPISNDNSMFSLNRIGISKEYSTALNESCFSLFRKDGKGSGFVLADDALRFGITIGFMCSRMGEAICISGDRYCKPVEFAVNHEKGHVLFSTNPKQSEMLSQIYALLQTRYPIYDYASMIAAYCLAELNEERNEHVKNGATKESVLEKAMALHNANAYLTEESMGYLRKAYGYIVDSELFWTYL